MLECFQLPSTMFFTFFQPNHLQISNRDFSIGSVKDQLSQMDNSAKE